MASGEAYAKAGEQALAAGKAQATATMIQAAGTVATQWAGAYSGAPGGTVNPGIPDEYSTNIGAVSGITPIPTSGAATNIVPYNNIWKPKSSFAVNGYV